MRRYPETTKPDRPNLQPRADGSVRIATYNIHHCRGTDREVSPARIAEVIGGLDADVVALQEVDVYRTRSGNVDQAETIARLVGMDVHFHPVLRLVDELYGIAVLSRFPMRVVKAGGLPQLIHRWSTERRGALWVEVKLPKVGIQVINTHFGLFGRERQLQAEALLGPDWAGHPECRSPKVLVGDFNSPPRSPSYRRLAATLGDAQARRGRGAQPTFPSRWPVLRLDHVFVSADIEVVTAQSVRSRLIRRASDHLPMVADLRPSEHAAAAVAQAPARHERVP